MKRIALIACGFAGFAVFALWTANTSAQNGPLRFDVASVHMNMTRPKDPQTLIGVMTEGEDRLNYSQVTLRRILVRAYNASSERVVGPSWIDQNQYDVAATFPSGGTKTNIPEMLQYLLADRFGVTVHKELREGPAYGLVLAKGGLKVQPSDLDPNSPLAKGIKISPNGHLEAKTLSSLARLLTTLIDRPVIDQTGVTGTFEIKFSAALEDLPKLSSGTGPLSQGSENAPSLVAALGDLGLALAPQRAELEYLVLDQAEKLPTAN